MLKLLLKLKPFEIIFTQPKSDRALTAQELAEIFISNNSSNNTRTRHKIIENPKLALNYGKNIGGREGLVIVAGSIYLIGEIV